MKLADAVTIVQVDDGRIQQEDFQSLQCSVSIELSDACDDQQAAALVTGAGLGVYTARPFMVRAKAQLSTRCAPEDYDALLRAAVESSLGFAVARALRTQPPSGGISADGVWIGSSDTPAVAYTGAAWTSDSAEFADAIAKARTLWHTRVVGAEPVLHVSPRALPGLGRATMLAGDPDKRVTCWGDPVVHDVGYDPLPGTDAPPVAFWAPKGFEVQVGEVETIGNDVMRPADNTRVFLAHAPVKIAVPPCAIVRVDTTLA